METRYVRISRFTELTGYSDDAVRAKITKGQWLEGREFRKAPDGSIMMDLIAYERWVEHNAAPVASVEQSAPQSKLNRDWLNEEQAAEHCGCSVWAFRRMRIPASNAGGRKVYLRQSLDSALLARPWAASGLIATATSSLPGRLTSKRLRPFVPRKPKS